MNTSSIRIEETLPINATGKTIFQAFTGSGLVASLVAHHLIDKLELTEKGYISSRYIPAIGIVKNGIVQRPVRIFENDSFVLILSEVGIPQDDLNEFVEGLFSWYKQVDPATIIIVGALPTGRAVEAFDLRYSLAVSNEVTKQFVEDKGLLLTQRSAVYGSVALSLMEAAKYDLNAMAILPHCIASIPDYLAAKKVIELLSTVLDMDIPLAPLDDNADDLREHLIHRKRSKRSKSKVDIDQDEETDEFDNFISDIMDMAEEDDDEDFDLSRFK